MCIHVCVCVYVKWRHHCQSLQSLSVGVYHRFCLTKPYAGSCSISSVILRIPYANCRGTFHFGCIPRSVSSVGYSCLPWNWNTIVSSCSFRYWFGEQEIYIYVSQSVQSVVASCLPWNKNTMVSSCSFKCWLREPEIYVFVSVSQSGWPRTSWLWSTLYWNLWKCWVDVSVGNHLTLLKLFRVEVCCCIRAGVALKTTLCEKKEKKKKKKK